ncbi:alpha/beta hydrolase [Paenisporosarcina sp. TG-14]|uniref:alpha/beta hydrolase n=1 Tax=Paenisporosarcina sp. TG-14 TaxID=1231057 RepID=UPI0002FA3C2D|nr:alpha/beta hydrolase [Paenisporosarcina sp. TG-14]
MWKWEADGQAKAVIAIIHSAYEHHRRYAWLIEKFRSSGFHVVMGDLPGHGEAARTKSAHDEDFKSYNAYIDQLVEASLSYNLPVFVMGHGLGATLVMHALQEKSIECAAVILTSPWLHLQIHASKLSSALSSMGKLTGNVKSTHEVTIKQLTRNYDVYTQDKDDHLYKTTITLKWYRELQNLMKVTSTKSESIQNLPVLMMTAERDKITDRTYSRHWLQKQQLSEIQYKEWENCYHDLFHEPEREDVFLYTESFMNNVLRSIGYIV